MLGLLALQITGLQATLQSIYLEKMQTVLRFELWTFLAVLTLLVFYQMMTGRIDTSGLPYKTTKDGSSEFSANRLQALIFTVGGAVYYLFVVLSNKDDKNFPHIPEMLLLILGGSNLLFLADKLLTLVAQKIKSA